MMINESSNPVKSNRTVQGIIHRFSKENTTWFINIPDLVTRGWKKEDMMIVDGGSKLLNVIAAGAEELMLYISNNPFEGATELNLLEQCYEKKGGGIYNLSIHRKNKVINIHLWICDFALNIFGDIPESIYIKKI